MSDPPSQAHGLPDPPTGGWLPLYDESIPPEARGQAFAQWISQYFPHKDPGKKDCHNLVYKMDSPVKTATFTGISFEELLTKVDLAAGGNGDNPVAEPHFRPIMNSVTQAALFDGPMRAAWGNIPFAIVYGEEGPYCIPWAVWKFEEQAEKVGLPIKVVGIPGGNHFVRRRINRLHIDSAAHKISRPCTISANNHSRL